MKKLLTIALLGIAFIVNASTITWQSQSAVKNIQQLNFISTAPFATSGEQTRGSDNYSGLLYSGYSPNAQVKTTTGFLLGTLSTYSDSYPEINTMKIKLDSNYLEIYEDGDTWGSELWIDVTEPMNPNDPGIQWLLQNISASAMATMELGYVDYDMGDENDPSTWDVFHPMVYSDAFSIQSLYDGVHISLQNDLNPPPYYTPWSPSTFYAVPEPSTVLLALLGIKMLIKRRKNTND